MGWQGSDRNAARTNTMSRFETETLTQEDNLKGLALMNPQWVELAMAHTPHRRVILDMDSSESPVHGQQEGAVAKVEWHQGELFPRVGFIVTNLSYPPKGIVRFYNGRGTAEQWIKEGKYALNWTRLSCHKFVANQVRLGLFIMAYNLGNFLRRLVLPESMKHWSLTSLQTRMIKTGGRLVRHARRLVFQLAEVLVSREMLCGILERIGRLRLAPG